MMDLNDRHRRFFRASGPVNTLLTRYHYRRCCIGDVSFLPLTNVRPGWQLGAVQRAGE